MAIEINGVSLPDIPEDVLKTCPYAVIAALEYNGMTIYSLLATQDEIVYAPPMMLIETAAVSSLLALMNGTCRGMEYFPAMGDTDWDTLYYAKMNDGVAISLGENITGTVTYDKVTVIWANHDIKTVSGVNADTGEITVGNEVYFYDSTVVFVAPERVIAPGEWFVAVADQARRLSGTGSRISIEKIQNLLEQTPVVTKSNWMADATYDPNTNAYTSEAKKIFVPAPYGLAGTGVTSVNIPNATEIEAHSSDDGNYLNHGPFYNCSKLNNINAPLLENVCSYAFEGTGLTEVTLPMLKTIENDCFKDCVALEKADFAVASSIGSYAFKGCTNLNTLILRRTGSRVFLYTSQPFNETPIKNGAGYVYVPSALMSAYSSDENWKNLGAKFRAIEDYPDICGTTT